MSQNAQKKLLFIYTETPLHAGSGRNLGYVDLPIQRERVTDYPMVQGSGVKGALRSELQQRNGWSEDSEAAKIVFGRADGDKQSHASAVTVGDAKLLLFPVRSLKGVFAWVTSVNVLSRFVRDAKAMGITINWSLPPQPSSTSDKSTCWAGTKVAFNKQVTLEEFTYEGQENEVISTIGNWLAKNALPPAKPRDTDVDEYSYWRKRLPGHLVILPDDDFRDFARYGTEIRTHINISPDTKTVKTGALWTTESLPTDALLYSPIIINKPRAQKSEPKNGAESEQTAQNSLKSAQDIENIILNNLDNQRINLGGDETTGQGVVMLHFTPNKAKNKEGNHDQ